MGTTSHIAIKEDWNDLAGYLLVKQNSKVLKKLRSSRKKLWCVYDEGTHQLQFYKSSKDAFVKMPSGSLNLQGAEFYYENTESFDFVINVNGKEHRFKAESYDIMMDWLRRLRDKVYPNDERATSLIEKRAKSLDFNTIADDETLFHKPYKSMSLDNLNETPGRSGIRRKRRIFLPWSFRRSNSSSTNVKIKLEASSPEGSPEDGNIMPISESANSFPTSDSLPLPSTRTSSASTKKWKCKSCASLSSNNDNLGDEVHRLTEKIRQLEEETSQNRSVIKTLNVENHMLKKDLVAITEDLVIQDEENDANLEYDRHCNKILEMLETARVVNPKLPDFKSATSTVYTDKLGFIHGERESPAQAFHYCCEQLKEHYISEARGEDLRTKWKEFMDKSAGKDLAYSDELKDLIIEGVPEELRPDLWKRLIADKVKHIKSEKGDDYYNSLCLLVPNIEDAEDEFDDSIEKQIRIDLLRTMPAHSNFKSFESAGIEMLYRVLRAFLLHSPKIGYCQGMNFMVAIGLLSLEEEDAFWLLVAITEVYFSSKHYNHYLTGSQADQKVLEELALKYLPNVMRAIKEIGCELSPVTFNWLMTLFVDSVPSEVALRILDCFFIEGHTVLYRFSLGLLKMNEGGICNKTEMLALMKYLKKIGHQIHDIDDLFKLSYGGFEPFPEKEVMEAMYERHFSVIQEAHEKREEEDKEYEKNKKHMRVQPKTITIQLGKDFDDIPEDFIIESCASEENANKVWLCCSTHNLGRLFVLDIVNRVMHPVDGDIKSRCLCLTRSKFSNTMIVGTADASLHGFDVETRKEIWSLQVDDSVSSISCDSSGNIVATLASGSIAVAQQSSEDPKPSRPVYLHIGRAPVVCGCICDNYFWCGCGNNIVIIDIETLDEVESIQVCPNLRHSISKLIVSDIGVWCSVRGSSVLQLFDKKRFNCVMTTDVMDESGLASEKISHLSSTRITAVLPRRNEVWVGQGNGRFLIFDVKQGPKPLSESTDSSIADLTETEINLDLEEETRSRTESKPIPIGQASSTCCHETLVRRTGNNLSSFSLGDSGFVFVSRLSGSQDKLEPDDKFHIVLKQLQRISEDPVRCLICVRNDLKQVLSCVGAINDELSIVLWSCERRQNKEMWYAQTVSYGAIEEEKHYTSFNSLKK